MSLFSANINSKLCVRWIPPWCNAPPPPLPPPPRGSDQPFLLSSASPRPSFPSAAPSSCHKGSIRLSFAPGGTNTGRPWREEETRNLQTEMTAPVSLVFLQFWIYCWIDQDAEDKQWSRSTASSLVRRKNLERAETTKEPFFFNVFWHKILLFADDSLVYTFKRFQNNIPLQLNRINWI